MTPPKHLQTCTWNELSSLFFLTEHEVPVGLRCNFSRKGKGKEKILEDKPEANRGWFSQTGAAQLYRGLGIRLTASAIVFTLALLTGESVDDGGWTEL